MNISKININELKSPKRNIRMHTEKQIEEFVRSIKMFGQIRPVVIDEDNTILAGNGLVMALKKVGIEDVEVYKIVGLSENKKKKLMIADNKIFNLGIDNLDTLNSFLEELHNDLDIPGFDEEILKTMIADAEQVTEKIEQYGILDEAEVNNFKASAERKEAFISKYNETRQQPIMQNNDDIPIEKVGKTDINDFIVCSKCGEKIWL